MADDLAVGVKTCIGIGGKVHGVRVAVGNRCAECQRAQEALQRAHRVERGWTYDAEYRTNRAYIVANAERCELCGAGPIDGDPWEADHIVPISEGGGHDFANLRVGHRSCNRSRRRSAAAKSKAPKTAPTAGWFA